MTSTSEPAANVRKSQIHGNGLFARKRIEPGQLILKLPRPLVAAIETSRLGDTCSNCFTWTASSHIDSRDYNGQGEVQACSGCKVPRYCSKQCQTNAWNRHHKKECKIFKSIPLEFIPYITRLWIQILCMKQMGTISSEEWTKIKQLESHISEFSKKHPKEWEQIQQRCASILPILSKTLRLESIPAESLHGQIMTNSLTVVTPTFDPLGISLDPLVAASNHSCDPNAFVVMDGPELSFRSLRPIAKDEEIFISYIDVTNPFPLRQHDLESRFSFTCVCLKCRKGPNLREDKFKIPPNQLGKELVDKADKLYDQMPQHVREKYHVGDDPAFKRACAIQAAAFTYCNSAKGLSLEEAIKSIDTGLRDCSSSGLFPLTRQPYPALRHSAMINHISAGNFPIALLQGIKIYCEVDPVLFPEPFHPVRVAHNWVLMKLMFYVVAEEEHRDFMIKCMSSTNVDFSLITYHLLFDLRENVKKSHGDDSSLAQAINKEFTFVLKLLDIEETAGDQAIHDAYKKAKTEQFARLRKLGAMLEF